MIHLLDKLTSAQLGLLLTIVIIGGYITICSVFHSVTVMIRGHKPVAQDTTAELTVTEGAETPAPSLAGEER